MVRVVNPDLKAGDKGHRALALCPWTAAGAAGRVKGREPWSEQQHCHTWTGQAWAAQGDWAGLGAVARLEWTPGAVTSAGLCCSPGGLKAQPWCCKLWEGFPWHWVELGCHGVVTGQSRGGKL